MIKDGFIPFGPYRTYYRIVGSPAIRHLTARMAADQHTTTLRL